MKIHALTLSWEGIEDLKKMRLGLCQNMAILYNKEGKLMPGCEVAEWHIRDNGSKDGTVKEVNGWRYLSDSNVICTPYDIGHNRDSFATGVNYLFEKANPKDDDLVVLVNNDVEFPKHDSILKMHRLMKKTKAAVVGVRLLYTGTDKLQHAGVIFGPRYGNMPYHFRHGEKSDSNAKKNRYFQAVTAAVCLINPVSFRRVGGMDEKFDGWCFEDVDLFLRIGQDEKIAYCGDTFIYHEESASLKKNPVNKLFMNKSVRYFREKWSGKYDLDHEKYLADSKYNEIK